jgi:hypothetical protein
MKKSKIRRSSDLPKNEGTVFVAWSPCAPFAVMGRRYQGELYVGNMYMGANGPISLEEARNNTADLAVEFVTGNEADDLIGALEKSERSKRPLFAFYRTSNIEAENPDWLLAGRLFIDMPKKTATKKSGKEMVNQIIQRIRSDVVAGKVPINGVMYGWDADRQPYCAEEIENDVQLINAWVKQCGTKVMVRLARDDAEDFVLDSEMRLAAGIAPDGSLLN